MSGTKSGGKLASQTMRDLYGEDYYIRIGAAGGRHPTTGGFAANRELARTAGTIGGKKSTRLGIPNGSGKSHRPAA